MIRSLPLAVPQSVLQRVSHNCRVFYYVLLWRFLLQVNIFLPLSEIFSCSSLVGLMIKTMRPIPQFRGILKHKLRGALDKKPRRHVARMFFDHLLEGFGSFNL